MVQIPDVKSRTEIRDGMKITWHQGIEASDGLMLRADIFQPIANGRYPVILTYGVYAKGLSYQEGYPHQWNKMVADHPEILEGSTNKYQNWEVLAARLHRLQPKVFHLQYGFSTVSTSSVDGSMGCPGFL